MKNYFVIMFNELQFIGINKFGPYITSLNSAKIWDSVEDIEKYMSNHSIWCNGDSWKIAKINLTIVVN